jgi:hypothetical protein
LSVAERVARGKAARAEVPRASHATFEPLSTRADPVELQATSDIFLGWLHIDSGLDGRARDFYGRQLKDWKGSAEIEQMVPKAMAAYGMLCGCTLARAHARSGDRIAIASYLGNGDSFDRAILEFSKTYAEQNERHYRELDAAVKSGRITAESGL